MKLSQTLTRLLQKKGRTSNNVHHGIGKELKSLPSKDSALLVP
jgi:hypothetical protein